MGTYECNKIALLDKFIITASCTKNRKGDCRSHSLNSHRERPSADEPSTKALHHVHDANKRDQRATGTFPRQIE